MFTHITPEAHPEIEEIASTMSEIENVMSIFGFSHEEATEFVLTSEPKPEPTIDELLNYFS